MEVAFSLRGGMYGEWTLVCEGTDLNLDDAAPTTSMLVERAEQLDETLPPAVGIGGPRELNRPASPEKT